MKIISDLFGEKYFYKHDLVVRVAWKYYKEELNQKEIADIFDISRFKVMDLLSEAKEEGIVQIKINSPIFNCLSLEEKIKKEFSLKDAFVVPTPKDKGKILEAIAYAGADYLENTIKSGDLIGTAWGRTLFQLSQKFTVKRNKYQNVSFILMLGGLAGENIISLNPYDVAKTLADKVGGNCYYIFAPAKVDSLQAKKFFIKDKRVSSALKKAKSVNKALVGIGQTTDEATLIKTDFITRKEMDCLVEKGAVGDIVGRYYDINGNLIGSKVDDMIVGLDLKEIAEIDEVIAFAGGEKKVKPILGALNGGFINSLITDEECAKSILKLKKKI
ncbi:MAG: sugar-binding transcriptional regulator [Halanaerobium sp.]